MTAKISILMMKMKKIKRRYGWHKDLPDQRDFKFKSVSTSIPVVDLRANCPVVYNQGNLGSCTANAIAGALEFEENRQKKFPIMPSRLFIYYNERVMENSISSDSGAQIRDGIKSVVHLGACSERLWPYIENKFANKPTVKCFKDALNFEALVYESLAGGLNDIRACLAAGFPVVFGFTVYASFESIGKDGMMPVPKSNEKVLGGHAVLCVGYDDHKQVFTIRNSWGSSWGDKGYFYMPYEFMQSNNTADFWAIKLVS